MLAIPVPKNAGYPAILIISANQHPDVVSTNLTKEVTLGRVAGPFDHPPLPNPQCHPVGVVPQNVPQNGVLFTTCHTLRVTALMIIFLKTPTPFNMFGWMMQSASFSPWVQVLSWRKQISNQSFVNLIPIHPDHWHLLGIYWQSQSYIDLYLPFGLRSAPFLFNRLSDVLECVLKNNYHMKNVIHILNDFFIAEPSRMQCFSSFSTLLCLFMSVNAPVVASKTWARPKYENSWVLS